MNYEFAMYRKEILWDENGEKIKDCEFDHGVVIGGTLGYCN